MGTNISSAEKPIPVKRALRKGDFFRVVWFLNVHKLGVLSETTLIGECIKLSWKNSGYTFKLIWTDSDFLKSQFEKVPEPFLSLNLPFEYLEGYFAGKRNVIKHFEVLSKQEALTYKI